MGWIGVNDNLGYITTISLGFVVDIHLIMIHPFFLSVVKG